MYCGYKIYKAKPKGSVSYSEIEEPDSQAPGINADFDDNDEDDEVV